MPKLSDVCHYIRSKNAGPFWITVDLFFRDAEAYRAYADADAISADLFARLFGVEASAVKIFPVPNLNVVKISYPRPQPQGWKDERDMHGGQQFAPLLAIELDGFPT